MPGPDVAECDRGHQVVWMLAHDGPAPEVSDGPVPRAPIPQRVPVVIADVRVGQAELRRRIRLVRAGGLVLEPEPRVELVCDSQAAPVEVLGPNGWEPYAGSTGQ